MNKLFYIPLEKAVSKVYERGKMYGIDDVCEMLSICSVVSVDKHKYCRELLLLYVEHYKDTDGIYVDRLDLYLLLGNLRKLLDPNPEYIPARKHITHYFESLTMNNILMLQAWEFIKSKFVKKKKEKYPDLSWSPFISNKGVNFYFIKACFQGNLEVVKNLINFDDKGSIYAGLFNASKHGHIYVVKYLVESLSVFRIDPIEKCIKSAGNEEVREYLSKVLKRLWGSLNEDPSKNNIMDVEESTEEIIERIREFEYKIVRESEDTADDTFA